MRGSPQPVQAAYCLAKHFLDEVYGPSERRDLAALVSLEGNAIAPDREWPGVEVLMAGWLIPRVDEAFLERFPRLRAIFYAAGSIRSFATEAMWGRGIRVTTSAAANAVPVAEFTLSQIFFALKQGWRQVRLYREMKDHACRRSGPFPGGYRSTVALLSLGLIGRMVAERLKTFDLELIAYDPCVDAKTARSLGVRLVSLEEAFAEADVVSCHTPLLPETLGMLRGRHFESMREGASFLNTARGEIVDEAELIAALRRRP
ncbi:MAG TPA: NAD(P)-dependent oxidoreductase, partial [Candidatus Methylacidiphilales bacterium]